MRGIVVLEGADGTGKTTLGKYLVDNFDAHYMHLTYRWPNTMFNYHLAAVHRAIKISQERLVVVDRCWLSECVYANIFRKGSKWPELGRMLDRILRRFGAIYVFCMNEDDEQYEINYNELKKTREEMYDNTLEVSRRYNQIWNGDSEICGIDYSVLISRNGGFGIREDCVSYRIEKEGRDIESFCNELVAKVNSRVEMGDFSKELREKIQDPRIYNFLGYLPECKYLIIGDRINKEKRQIDYPWTAHKRSSLFLANCLTRIGVDETSLCHINRNDLWGLQLIDMIRKETKCHRIFLGKDAAKWVHSAPLLHPAYALRFGKEVEFIETLDKELHS